MKLQKIRNDVFTASSATSNAHAHKGRKIKRENISQIRDRILYDAFTHPWLNGKTKQYYTELLTRETSCTIVKTLTQGY
jgi:hypothetical protein